MAKDIMNEFELNNKKGIQYNKASAHDQCKIIIKQLDGLELRHWLTDIHASDVMTNESAAFYALQKALAAFRELEAKF